MGKCKSSSLIEEDKFVPTLEKKLLKCLVISLVSVIDSLFDTINFRGKSFDFRFLFKVSLIVVQVFFMSFLAVKLFR